MFVPARRLVDEQVQSVQEPSFKILQMIDLWLRSRHAWEILAQHGCAGDSEAIAVRFSRALGERWRIVCCH